MAAIQRLAILSVHASPLAPMGGKKTGGMNVYVRNLAQEFGRRGLLVDIYTRQTSPENPIVDESLGENVRVIHVTAGGHQALSPDELFPHLPEFAAGVIAYATRSNLSYNLIYSHYWLSGWVANTLRTVWGIPFVHMFHTLGHMKNRIVAQSASPNQRIHVETQITQWADRIIAATPAEYMQLRWLYRANRRKISVVSPGVDPSQFRPISANTARSRLNLPDESNLLLFVGRIEPLKGVDTAIDALAVVRSCRPDLYRSLQFIVIGGSPSDPADTELARLQSRVQDLNMGAAVTFVGARDQEALLNYYTAASAVIMPSDYESFGMVALEAMASGTPVIASEVGGLAFLVQDHKTGFLVPTRDPQALAQRIIALLEHPAMLRTMGQAAAQLAQQYAWSTIADDLLDAFDEVSSKVPVSPHTH
ncbi:MAG: glycosyltransferase [Anaerolineae bacterium]|nr:glycosyltransferase [Anaerolineae bacterium]